MMTSSSFASLALLGLLATAWAVEPSCADADGASCAVEEDTSLLMLNRKHGGKREYKPRDIHSKSLYFVVTDYFAGPPPGQPEPANCEGQGWCNGTIKGITNKLDYIQGMGFEGIWVTPLIKQFYGPDPDGRSGYGQYGYWAEDWYKIDPNYGTAEELKELSQELHKRDMVFVYDIVLNHVGPVHSEADFAKFSPFNKPEYLHQRGIGDMTFDEYTKGYAYGGKGYPPPVQGIGPGAMCIPGPEGCSNYHCPVDPGFGHPCPVEPTFLGDLNPPQHAPGPREIPNCGVGDLVCAGYDEEQTIEGWFYDLGDLNHSHPFVHDELIKWGVYMRDTYHIDGFRLDTAPYVSKEFLSDFQAAVKIPILGEVTTSNWTFFKSYAPPPSEGPVLKGLLNFYIQNVATPAFCGPPAFFPGADLNLSSLAANLGVQDLDLNGVNDLDLFGNFVDNHDTARLALYCGNVMSRMKNALAFTMLARGIPIIYSGTEHFFDSTHPAMWNTGYATDTPGYAFIRNLNNARKNLQLNIPSGMKVEAADENRLIFSRQEEDMCAESPNSAYGVFEDPCCQNLEGPGCDEKAPVGCAAGGLPQRCRYCFLPDSDLNDGSLPECPGSNEGAYIFLNNFDDETKSVEYHVAGFLPAATNGMIWVDVLHGYRAATITAEGKFLSPDTEPAALQLVKMQSLSELQQNVHNHAR